MDRSDALRRVVCPVDLRCLGSLGLFAPIGRHVALKAAHVAARPQPPCRQLRPLRGGSAARGGGGVVGGWHEAERRVDGKRLAQRAHVRQGVVKAGAEAARLGAHGARRGAAEQREELRKGRRRHQLAQRLQQCMCGACAVHVRCTFGACACAVHVRCMHEETATGVVVPAAARQRCPRPRRPCQSSMRTAACAVDQWRASRAASGRRRSAAGRRGRGGRRGPRRRRRRSAVRRRQRAGRRRAALTNGRAAAHAPGRGVQHRVARSKGVPHDEGAWPRLLALLLLLRAPRQARRQ
eukprot:scaffold40561_cov72-Phaeocystis_antarctica.AAC.9